MSVVVGRLTRRTRSGMAELHTQRWASWEVNVAEAGVGPNAPRVRQLPMRAVQKREERQ
jgi:hypothetical protein